MSSLIEQAAKRLAQLRQAGAEIPETPPALPQEREEPTIVAAAALISASEQVKEPEVRKKRPTPNPGTSPRRASGGGRSKRIELNLDAIAASGIVIPNQPRSQIADQYRVIKRPLLANAMGKGTTPPVPNGNLVMVTSALPREGKTFTAINLAMSIATELNNTVLLVDADVARPSFPEMLGLPRGRGLLDMLQDPTVDLSDALLKTNVDKLTILPSGNPHPRATELLASDAMAALLSEMASRYSDRIIIFDSPPLLPTTESRVLASHMGQIVMVVEAERTLQSEVAQALATIEACPVKLMILNKAKAESKSGYSYGYGYALGYG